MSRHHPKRMQPASHTHEAIDRLAALFQNGALTAAVAPAEFLDQVAAEVVRLRALLAAKGGGE